MTLSATSWLRRRGRAALASSVGLSGDEGRDARPLGSRGRFRDAPGDGASPKVGATCSDLDDNGVIPFSELDNG